MLSWRYFPFILFMLSWTTCTQSAQLEQKSTGLFVTPERCVALRQGQTCYQEITFRWRQPKKGNYCLINLSTKQVLTCWENTNHGEFHLDFQATRSTDFAVRTQDQEIDLSTTQVTVAWVFKSSKRPKSSWRLF